METPSAKYVRLFLYSRTRQRFSVLSQSQALPPRPALAWTICRFTERVYYLGLVAGIVSLPISKTAESANKQDRFPEFTFA